MSKDPKKSITKEEDQFPALLKYTERVWKDAKDKILLKVDGEGLDEIFLSNMSDNLRQEYNCNCCKSFLRRYGGVVEVDDKGKVHSLLWAGDNIPAHFEKAVKALKEEVEKRQVVKVFLYSDSILGINSCNGWAHLYIVNHKKHSGTLTAGQKAAEHRENKNTLSNALEYYTEETLSNASALLSSGTFRRAEKGSDRVDWLVGIKNRIKNRIKNKAPEAINNLLFRYAFSAPSGWCSVKSSVIGPLLDAIQEGKSVEAIKAIWEANTSAETYMHSTVAPTENQVQLAEKQVEALGITESLLRRGAEEKDITEWFYKQEVGKKKTGVFSSVVTKPADTESTFVVPPTKMSWGKFFATILPSAKKIMVKVSGKTRHLVQLTAPSISESKNILQWDNNISWTYFGGITDATIKERVEKAGGKYENNDIRVSLIWNTRCDLDLHVKNPRGEILYYGRKHDNVGGYLDVDMNISGETLSPVENTRWPVGTAPKGTYEVSVVNFTNRNGGKKTPYKVELQVGSSVYSFQGSNDRQVNDPVVSFYFDGTEAKNLNGGTYTSAANNTWGLVKDTFVPIVGITKSPNQWGNNSANHQGRHLFVLVDGCVRPEEETGGGLFVEHLISDLRPHRKVLDSYLSNQKVSGSGLCGYGYNAQEQDWDLTVKVVCLDGKEQVINIDRWE